MAFRRYLRSGFGRGHHVDARLRLRAALAEPGRRRAGVATSSLGRGRDGRLAVGLPLAHGGVV
eukprot:scaffold1509_cov240-Pinguiococcus_pyrenoidosus.AAC.55